jgi:hypothetical protein
MVKAKSLASAEKDQCCVEPKGGMSASFPWSGYAAPFSKKPALHLRTLSGGGSGIMLSSTPRNYLRISTTQSS